MHLMRKAWDLERASAGKSIAARIAMMAITTSNSISVKPRPARRAGCLRFNCRLAGTRQSFGQSLISVHGTELILDAPLLSGNNRWHTHESFRSSHATEGPVWRQPKPGEYQQFVRIADSSEAVAVANHVVAGSARIRGLRESISEVCGYWARGAKIISLCAGLRPRSLPIWGSCMNRASFKGGTSP